MSVQRMPGLWTLFKTGVLQNLNVQGRRGPQGANPYSIGPGRNDIHRTSDVPTEVAHGPNTKTPQGGRIRRSYGSERLRGRDGPGCRRLRGDRAPGFE